MNDRPTTSESIDPASALPDHHLPNGAGFRNPWPSFQKRNTLELMGSLRKEPDKADIAALLLLASKPDFAMAEATIRRKPRSVLITWIGHCTCVIQVNGGNFLTDPIWSLRTGSFPGPKRVVPPPCRVDELPHLDAIFITCNRPDNLDRVTVRELGDRAVWYVPLGVGDLLRSEGVTRIVEMDWWQEHSLSPTVTVACTPSQHFSGRTTKDRDQTLWCSWAVIGPHTRFFFAGNTGYRTKVRRAMNSEHAARTPVTAGNPPLHGGGWGAGGGAGANGGGVSVRGELAAATMPLNSSITPQQPQLARRNGGGRAAEKALPECPVFSQIGAKYGHFDVALLPIGGYSPRHILSPVNADPADAVAMHMDLNARYTAVIGWGTFMLSEEELLEPLRELERALSNYRVPESDIVILKHGKTQIL